MSWPRLGLAAHAAQSWRQLYWSVSRIPLLPFQQCVVAVKVPTLTQINPPLLLVAAECEMCLERAGELAFCQPTA